MTSERAEAYARVMAIVDDAPDLQPGEERQLRDAADALLFAPMPGVETSEALSETRALSLALAESGRWPAQRVGDLLAGLHGCGPDGLPFWGPSRVEQRFVRGSNRLRARR
jgi:hypothetical protein